MASSSFPFQSSTFFEPAFSHVLAREMVKDWKKFYLTYRKLEGIGIPGLSKSIK
jgi:hypothetical protein